MNTKNQQCAATSRLAHVVGIWDWEPSTGRCVWNSDNYLLHGVSEDTPVGWDMWQGTMLPEDRALAAEATIAAMHSCQPIQLTYRVQDRCGHVRMLLGRGMAVRDADGDLLRVVGSNIDVTPLWDCLTTTMHDIERLAETLGVDDAEPDLSQRLTRKIQTSVRAVIKNFFV